jgi:8-oxo-dGTP diphosphatase
MSFKGAKLALFLGKDLLVIRRDDRPDIPFPDHWDLPGGGREGRETPAQCALRETREEVGLDLRESDLVWSLRAERWDGATWFFAAHRPASDVEMIRFGDEGQGWELMPPDVYVNHPRNVSHLAARVDDYLKARNRKT